MSTATDESRRARLPERMPVAVAILLGILVGLCSWSYLGSAATPTVDGSWELGLQMAAAQGLHFGSGVVFTYGPLGFLQAPVAAIDPYPELGGLYILAIRLGLGVTLVWATGRAFGLWLAFPISLVAALLLLQEPVVALAMIWCLVALGPRPPSRIATFFPPIAATVAALEMLGKLSIGPLILAICLIAVLAMEGRRGRNLLSFCGTFLLVFLASWFATGQAVSDVGPFARGSFEVVSGYATAMPLSAAPGERLHMIAAVGMLIAGLLAGYLATRELPATRRLAVAAVIVIGGFAVWKMSFVRYGPPTYLYLFPVMLAPWLAFPWRDISLPRGVGGKLATPALALIGAAAIAGIYFPLTEQTLSNMNPVQRLEAGVEQLEDLVLPDHVDRLATEARAQLQGYYGLEPRYLTRLEGHSVNVDPSEIAIAWAYDLDWRPLPAFQAYTAYTPYLDQRNKDSLLAGDGPERILRTFTVQLPEVLNEITLTEAQTWNSYSTSDGRLRAWDQPRTNLAMLCNYRALLTDRAYQVLTRTADRCGRQRPLGEAEAELGEEIPVPMPPHRDDVVLAEVSGLAPHGIEGLRTLLYRAAQTYVAFNGAGPMQYRVLPDDGGDRILRAAPGVDFPRPFALAPQARTVRFEKEPGRLTTRGPVKLKFYAMRVRPAA